MAGANRVRLRWVGAGTGFRGRGAGEAEVTLDGEGSRGPTPMEALLLSLAGCTAVDVLAILGKMRVALEGLEVEVEGERGEEPPRRYTRIRAVYRLKGLPEGAHGKAERAVRLSAERYCSVLHSLRPDIEFTTQVVRG